jgi:hypothetical protein
MNNNNIHGGLNLEERSNSFFDELNDEVNILNRLDDIKSPGSESHHSTNELKELSFYALEVENIEELIR